jgi:hypothetical protein
MSRLLTATTIGLPLSDQLLFSVRLEMVRLNDGRAFAYSNDARAPIVLANPTEPAGLAALNGADPNGRQVVIRYGEALNGELALKPPFRITDMQAVLGAATQRLKPGHLALTEEQPTQPHRVLETSINALRESQLYQKPMRLLGFNELDLLLYPDRQQFRVRKRLSGAEPWWTALKSFRAVLLSPAGHIDEERLSIAMPYDILRWHLALNLSFGLLLPTVAHFQKFSFVGWPNFGSLGATRDHLRMAALLVNRPVGLADLIKLTQVPREEAIGFLNACALIGKLREATIAAGTPMALRSPTTATINTRTLQVPVTPRAPSTRAGFAGFLGKLRDALTLGRR